MKKVYLTGKENINWAVTDDYKLVKRALKGFVEFVEDINQAEIVHTVSWPQLLNLNIKILKTKKVIAHISHDVRAMLMQPEYLKIAPVVDYWLAPSKKAKQFLDILGLPNYYVPYAVDQNVFYPIKNKITLRKNYNLPTDKYLIGSFQRDTEGKDLKTPKYVKGPDILLEIVKKVYEKSKNIHIVLAGPRRFWLRKSLEKYGVPFTYIGQKTNNQDDLKINILDKQKVNELYNAIDLNIVSSRYEGGPKAILECSAAKTKIISTNVGQAPDILADQLIYNDFLQAKDLILNDILNNSLAEYTNENYIKSQEFSINRLKEIFSRIYSDLDQGRKKKILNYKTIKKINKKSKLDKLFKNKIIINFKFKKGPWGGGNQFLKALAKNLQTKKWKIKNSLSARAKVLLFNSFHIDEEKIKEKSFDKKLIVHRIDGPTYLIRDKDQELDDKIFKINNKIADITVFQSMWSLINNLILGYQPINPILTPNASDNEIFNKDNKLRFTKNRKIKLISTSWSNNPKKGAAVYKWLDENLDWSKYEYTFIGRIAVQLNNINLVSPVSSIELANLIKQHDIYITASDNDPCSNAVIEALSCGLPVVYLNRGGHPELVQFGGLGFNQPEQIPDLLEKIINNYFSFQNLITENKIDDITNLYIRCFNL